MAYRYQRMRPSGQTSAPVVLNLLIANVVMFLLPKVMDAEGLVFDWLALWPWREPGFSGVQTFWPWQVLSYGFLHDPRNIFHVFFNMYALYVFGRQLEMTWGSQRFFWFYLTCVVGAGMVQLVVATMAFQQGVLYPTVGASGGVYGVLLGFGWFFPRNEITAFPIMIPIEARYYVAILGGLALFSGLGGVMPGVAHFAHLGGMVFGAIFILATGRGLR